MKTLKTLCLCGTLLAAALPLTSCSDDDDEPTLLNESVCGTYDGYTCTYIKYSDVPMFFKGEQLVVTSTKGNTASVELVSQAWSTVAEGCTVSLTDGYYVIEGAATSYIGGHLENGEVGAYYGTLTATISEDGSECECDISLPGVMGGVTVQFVKATEEEQEEAQEETGGVSITGPSSLDGLDFQQE
ncbi:MAG: hypothetical protein LUC86_05840 [Prevotellaceae bacterium]|nr:hypothetical protein [Prevotellaceae bacterium]